MTRSNIGDKVNSVAQTAAAVSTMSMLKENLSKFNEQKAKEAEALAKKQMKQTQVIKKMREHKAMAYLTLTKKTKGGANNGE